MSFRYFNKYYSLISPVTSLTSTTAQSLVTTDAKMRFQMYEVLIELASVSGFSSVPTIGIGVTSPNYTDQIASLTLTSLSSSGGLIWGSAGGALALSIAPNTAIFIKPSIAAVATTYNVRVFIMGDYY